jgi:hypothetical protein
MTDDHILLPPAPPPPPTPTGFQAGQRLRAKDGTLYLVTPRGNFINLSKGASDRRAVSPKVRKRLRREARSQS